MTSLEETLDRATKHMERTVENSPEWPLICMALKMALYNKPVDLLLAACAYLIDTADANGLPKGFALSVLAHRAGVLIEVLERPKEQLS